ncbi:hypothetical protein D3C71_1645600 [compost metagenome]
MHQPSRQQREKAGDNDAAEIHASHMAAMCGDVMSPGGGNRLPAAEEHIDRQQVNGAETADQSDFVNEERGGRGHHHEREPDLAEKPMQARTLWTGEQKCAKDCGRNDGRDVQLDCERCMEERCKCHGQFLCC